MITDWNLLERWDVLFGILGGMVLLISGIHWLLRRVDTSLITDAIAWALIGEADKTKLFSTMEYVAKWLLALTIWALIGMAAGMVILGIRTVVFNGLSFGVPGSDDLWKRSITLGAIGGSAFRATWPVISFVYKRYLQVLEQERSHSN